MADLDQVVMGLRQARTAVRAKMVAMEILQADLVVGMARVIKGRVEDLEAMEARMGTLDQKTMEGRTRTLVQEAMEDRMDNLGQGIMEAQTATLDLEAMEVRMATLDQKTMEARTATPPVQETMEAQTTTQAPTMAPASQAPANRTKAASSHKSTCTRQS